MESLFKFLTYVVIGLMLVMANIWYFRSIYHSISREVAPISLRPFRLVGKDEENKGAALTLMLSTQLEQIVAGIRDAVDQSGNISNPDDSTYAVLPDILPVDIESEVFQPVDIQASISGLEVGGIISRMQETLSADRRLQIVVWYREATKEAAVATIAPPKSTEEISEPDPSDSAEQEEPPGVEDEIPATGKEKGSGQTEGLVVSGTFGKNGQTFWLERSNQDEIEMIRDIAYAIIHQRAQVSHPQLKSYSVAQFRQLMEIVTDVAKLNRRLALSEGKKPKPADYEGLLGNLRELHAVRPDWEPLATLATKVAENAQETETAVRIASASLESMASGETKVSLTREVASLREKNDLLSLEGNGGEVDPKIEESRKSIREMLGVPQNLKSFTADSPKIGILGDPRVPGGLPEGWSVIGGQNSDAIESNLSMASYAYSVGDAVRIIAPNAKLVFRPIQMDRSISFDKVSAAIAELAIEGAGVILAPYNRRGVLESHTDEEFDSLGNGELLFVVSAGHEDSASTPWQTQTTRRILVAGALDRNGKKASFSLGGYGVLWAPGANLLLANGSRSRVVMSGTAYSAAFAAGVAIHLLNEHPEMTPERALEILRNSSRRQDQATPMQGNPAAPAILNLNRALEEAQNTTSGTGS